MARTRNEPVALAYGPVTASKIESVRTQLASAERAVGHYALRYRQRELHYALKELAARRGEPRNPRR